MRAVQRDRALLLCGEWCVAMCAVLLCCAAVHTFAGGGSAMSFVAPLLAPGPLASRLLPKALLDRPRPETGNVTALGSMCRDAMLICKSY